MGTTAVGTPRGRGTGFVAVAVTVACALAIALVGYGAGPAVAANGQLVLEQLPMDDACSGLTRTGTPPFDATDGEGLDAGSGNCVVRVNDSVFQNYSVSLTGLDAGQSVRNVILELTIHPGATRRSSWRVRWPVVCRTAA